MSRLRREARGQVTYAEAVRRVEGRRVSVQTDKERTEEVSVTQNIIMDKRRFLAFIAMVINCAADIKTKSERIKMILHDQFLCMSLQNSRLFFEIL